MAEGIAAEALDFEADGASSSRCDSSTAVLGGSPFERIGVRRCWRGRLVPTRALQ